MSRWTLARQRSWDAILSPPPETLWLQFPHHKGEALKYLMWLLNAAIFFALFAFALNNQDNVTLHLFFGVSWQAPLVLVVLLSVLVGVFLGVIVMVPLWLRAKRARHPAGLQTNDSADTSLMPNEPDRPHGL